MAFSRNSLQAVLEAGDPPSGDAMAVGTAIAERLCRWLEKRRAATEIEEVYCWAFNVEFVLKNGDHWTIECLSPEEFRMYPGFVRGDTVVWANVWVRDNMQLDELVKWINDAVFKVDKKEFENA